MATQDQHHNKSNLVYASILIYIVALSAYTLLKHAFFKTYAWDLGIYGQAFWNTVNTGEIFTYNCERHLVESDSFFGAHFSPASDGLDLSPRLLETPRWPRDKDPQRGTRSGFRQAHLY